MSRIMVISLMAALVVVAGAAVVSPAGAQPLANPPYVLAYRGGVSQTAPTPLIPQQNWQSPGQPAGQGRPDEKAYSYDGNPSTTGRAYEVPGAPPQSGRPLPAYVVPGQAGPRPLAYQAQRPAVPVGPSYPAPYSKEIPLMDCDIVAADGTFLGSVNREYGSPQSLSNRNSAYASPYSRFSIFNANGPYGSPCSALSAWDPQTTTPPALYWQGRFKCYLTMNQRMCPRIPPLSLANRLSAPGR